MIRCNIRKALASSGRARGSTWFDLLAVGDVEHLPQPEAGDEPGDVVGVARSGPVVDGENLVRCQLQGVEGLADR